MSSPVNAANLSLIVQIAFLVLAMAVGFAVRRKVAIPIGALIGLTADIVAQILIAGGGPGAFVGLLVLPCFAVLCVLLGRALKSRFDR